MRIATLIGLVVFICAGMSANAAYVEYQGTGGSLVDASKWYVITNPNNPTSTTGVTRLPTKYVGTYPTGTPGDLAIIRNSTSSTVYGTLDAQNMSIGGPAVTGVPTRPATNVYVPSGGTISMYSDVPSIEDPPENLLHFNIGEAYPGTLNMIGGTVKVNPRRGGGIYIGTSSTGTGVLNMSSGIVQVQQPVVGDPTLAVGYNGGNGRINQTGGSILIVGDTGSSKTNFRLGSGGYGQVDISDGYFSIDSVTRIGHEYNPTPDVEGDELPGTGILNITGGTFQYGYRVLVGDGNRNDANKGHIRALGGTIMSNPSIDPTFAGHIWLGRGNGLTATPGAIGKMTVTQAVVIDSHGLVMGRDGFDTTNSQLELKIDSDADFQISFESFTIMQGALEVSLVNGYTPAIGTDWRVVDSGNSPVIWILDMPKITPGFRLEARSLDVYLVVDSLQHAGDANNDGFVDVGDLGILAFNWGQTDMWGKSWVEADFTGDDIVDVGDLGVLAFNWGWSGTPAGAGSALPEPASLTLLGLGGLAVLRRRR